MTLITQSDWSNRRSVIGHGIEEEDRMDQWIEDAESVSGCGFTDWLLTVLSVTSVRLMKPLNVPEPFTPTH